MTFLKLQQHSQIPQVWTPQKTSRTCQGPFQRKESLSLTLNLTATPNRSLLRGNVRKPPLRLNYQQQVKIQITFCSIIDCRRNVAHIICICIPLDFAVGGGCFGKGVKSKMKERRKKQQLILNEFRPKWNFTFSPTSIVEPKDTSELGKRVRFDVSKNEEIL